MLIEKQYDHENVSYKIISKDDISRAVKKVHSNKASNHISKSKCQMRYRFLYSETKNVASCYCKKLPIV